MCLISRSSEVATTLERSDRLRKADSLPPVHASTCAKCDRAAPARLRSRSNEIDAKHEQLYLHSSWRQHGSGDLHALTQLLASEVRVVTDGGGKVAAALNVIEGADRAARFLVGVARKGWREDFRLRFAVINNLPGVIVDG